MNLVLSPLLFNICSSSGAFMRRFRRGELNVCNVVRSLLFVILFYDVFMTGLAVFLLDVILKIPFVMFTFSMWNPFDATSLIVDMARTEQLDPTRFGDWWFKVSSMFSAVFVLLGASALAIFVLFLLIVGVMNAFEKASKMERGELADKVLTPLDVGVEWIAAKHNRVCLNIDSRVKVSFAEELRDHLDVLNQNYFYEAMAMTKAQLQASIEQTRSVLMKHVQPT